MMNIVTFVKTIHVILYSPAKINIGLQILRKRSDGFHDIATLMYVLPLNDILEVNPAQGKNSPIFSQSGIIVPGEIDSHLCIKAWKLFSEKADLPSLRIHLHKQIPIGAGLGGGSSNAATTLVGLNHFSNNTLSRETLITIAELLGSDCPVFINGKHAIAEGRGEILSESKIVLSGYFLALFNPGIHISSADAYKGCTPREDRIPLSRLLSQAPAEWRKSVSNDFEESIFPQFPEIEQLKKRLYQDGAIYASMSGSGSSVYGIFREAGQFHHSIEKYLLWSGWL